MIGVHTTTIHTVRYRKDRQQQQQQEDEDEDDEEAATAIITATATATAVSGSIRIYILLVLVKEENEVQNQYWWSGYYILNQTNDMRFMREVVKEEVFAQQNGGASVIAFSGTGLLLLLLHGRCYYFSFSTIKKRRHSTDGDKTISMYPF